ncbi:hypothetical protein BV511_14890 [Methylorubrum extorquens]|nr:hypothetical protein BV511_14890 [Methylorubrum extorquens]
MLASLGKPRYRLCEVAVRIVCAARQQRIPIDGDPANGTCQVGGFVQLGQIDPPPAEWSAL